MTTIFGLFLLQSSHLTCFMRVVEGQVFPGQPSRTAPPCPGSGGGRSSKGSKLQHTGFQLHHSTALHWPTEHRLPWLQQCLEYPWRSAKCISHRIDPRPAEGWAVSSLAQQPLLELVGFSETCSSVGNCWPLECYKTKQNLWRPTLDA